ncbi:hypothetical protein MJO28_013780 [Puccinia striiformis f. sp. tritici]|uniref:DUF155 domain-containing protein n=2 Tax=Puccinia striiformis f. sp. tritici TaxID=168172 RepID=A0A0L0V177_9BASI|nr:hypothetical protein Pst134EA_025679 [Puccinia striiformis f. sp. tritici]KAI9628371.1 hypothetical protein KEM48_011654 [Puccinia striiformis f. sp. tritici PST-130]KNE92779.1 hypothetical protein PSTG_13836 [Puccinia striiformis f. sp. tritici PST-78]KAH9443911.1 hypothetical protein Pst134EB_026301 [Puccinia striiformis f. sp. tritici]KAH9451740.1 hypothetical protein Pst134EA_025679 [Puccinia striiformis f. sp. tritici]KAI7940128.1 hypothetical protein MJO28_013780 [Puccinia striiformis
MFRSNFRSIHSIIVAQKSTVQPKQNKLGIYSRLQSNRTQSTLTGPEVEATSSAGPITVGIAKKTSKKRVGPHGQASILKWDLKKGTNSSGRPTRSIGEVIAYSTAEEYDLRTLPKHLDEAGYPGSTRMFNVLGEAIWLPQWPPSSSSDSQNLTTDPTDRTGEIFVFESGSFVSWGISSEEATKFLETIIRPKKEKVRNLLEVNPSRIPEKETVDYLESNSGPMFEVDMDQIVVCANRPDSGSITEGQKTPNMSGSARTRKLLTPFMSPVSLPSQPHDPSSDSLLLSKLAVSSALARACRLSRYEAQLDEFLSKVEHVPAQLKTGNDSPLNKNEIIARYGELLELRQGLSLKEENLIDLPEWFWEDTGAEERHFKKVLREFDFERRLRVLNDKLSMAIELQGRLFEFSNSKYSHRLEWIIIILIAFEIAHAVYAADHYHE